MEDNENKSKNKLAAFWSVKRNRIITCAVGGALVVGIVLAIALPLGLNKGNNSNSSQSSTSTSNSGTSTSSGGDGDGGKTSYAPIIDEANKEVKYGLYPQTHVGDATTIASLDVLTVPEENGWYLYNGEYYTKEAAVLWEGLTGTTTFSDGTPIVDGNEYWFKCEPIEWNILDNSNGTYSLVSTLLLDTCQYEGTTNNNYKNSYIRKTLNGDFFDTAFNLDSSYIQTVNVDNSASTTMSDSNEYACENTEDKVYLLSYKDYMNDSYFSDDSKRKCKVTDYALANESIYVDGYGEYWTRSPHPDYPDFAAVVYSDGSIVMYYTNFTIVDIRPAITIKL